MTMARNSASRSKGISSALLVAMISAAITPLRASSTQRQTEALPGGAIENTQVVITGGMANINYDLRGPAAQTYNVGLEVSQDGGRTYVFKPKSLTGDIGPGVRPGTGRKIVWEAAKDTDSLQLNEYRFRVTASPEEVATTQETVRTPPQQPNHPRNAATPTKHARNPLLWQGIGMIGGGVAIAVMASGNGPLRAEKAIPPPSICGDTNICHLPAPNKPVIATGGAVAGAGAFLLLWGQHRASSSPSIGFTPKAVFVSNTIRF
jgi:hypothetical protein